MDGMAGVTIARSNEESRTERQRGVMSSAMVTAESFTAGAPDGSCWLEFRADTPAAL